jgi:hypothetical protein
MPIVEICSKSSSRPSHESKQLVNEEDDDQGYYVVSFQYGDGNDIEYH